MSTRQTYFCNAVADEPGPLPARCSRRPHATGDHEWGSPDRLALEHVALQQQEIATATIAAISASRVKPSSSPETGGDRLPGTRGVVRRVTARWTA